MIYAPALGDPEGPALLGGDIAQRHNFGLVGPAGMRRDFVAWALPKEQVGDGSPWHVEGSILGLDIALARLALRRIADNEMPVAPTINLNDQLTFARTVMALNPRALRDADRDRIVAAIARGRERVTAAGANLPAVLALAIEAQLPQSVRQTLPWTHHAHARRGAVALRAARPAVARQARAAAGRRSTAGASTRRASRAGLKTAMPRPTPWENFGGRADGGLVATQAPDLMLRLARRNGPAETPGPAGARPARCMRPRTTGTTSNRGSRTTGRPWRDRHWRFRRRG